MRTGALLAIVLLALIALAHLVRFVAGIEIVAGGVHVPLWASLVGAVVPAGIAWQLWREQRAPRA